MFVHAFFPEIAASFAKGIHFNTFGGNPVACAVGSSVLDVRMNLLFSTLAPFVRTNATTFEK